MGADRHCLPEGVYLHRRYDGSDRPKLPGFVKGADGRRLDTRSACAMIVSGRKGAANAQEGQAVYGSEETALAKK